MAELYGNYAGMTISDIIRHPDTVAVFVLLGKNLEKPPTPTPQYTHNWVSFEVGVASSSQKPIWVFEEFGSLIRFPIPFVTDYAQYTLESLEHLQYYERIFQERIIYRTNSVLPVPTFQCPYTDCNAIYNCWSIAKKFHCPVCRSLSLREAKNLQNHFTFRPTLFRCIKEMNGTPVFMRLEFLSS
jgi:hypothetical protein